MLAHVVVVVPRGRYTYPAFVLGRGWDLINRSRFHAHMYGLPQTRAKNGAEHRAVMMMIWRRAMMRWYLIDCRSSVCTQSTLTDCVHDRETVQSFQVFRWSSVVVDDT